MWSCAYLVYRRKDCCFAANAEGETVNEVLLKWWVTHDEQASDYASVSSAIKIANVSYTAARFSRYSSADEDPAFWSVVSG